MAETEDQIRIDPAAVLELDVHLRQAFAHQDDQVAAKRLALGAVVRFLLRHDRWRDAALPLMALESELPDLLLPNPGGRPAGVANNRLRGYAAGIMEGLMKHGRLTKAQAARWVAGHLTQGWWKVSPYTVISWRDDARRPENAVLHRAYRDCLNPMFWARKPAEVCAEEIIARLTLVHRLQQREE